MKIKKVCTWSKRERKLRLFRIMWQHGVVGDGDGYSVMLSIGIVPNIALFSTRFHEWRLVVCGLAVHYQRAYGGIHV